MPRPPRWPDDLAHLSHEVRTHVQGILGLVDWLRESRLSDGQRAALARLRAGGESLLELVNGMLAPKSPACGDFVPADIAEDVTALLAPAAQARGVEVVCAADPERQAVIGDPAAFRKIAMNLVGNAVKFTERGHIVVRLDARPDGARARLRLSVSDSGVGIGPADRRRVFAPHFQVRRDKGGSGLGLPLARSLARSMGGDVRLASREGRGSAFSATLRLPRVGGSRFPPPSGRPCVIAGGHPEQRRWLARVLLRCGAPCATCEPNRITQTSEALRRSTGETPLVLLDVPAGSRRPAGLAPETVLLHPPGTDLGRHRGLAKPLRAPDLFALLNNAPTGYAPATGARRGRRILLLDDDPAGRAVTARQLVRRGHRVRVVGDAAEGIRQVRRGTWDLAILDLQLGGDDGVEIARAFRRLRPGLPLLALTGHAGPEARARCLRAGFNAHLAKPAGETDLVRVAEQLAEEGAVDNEDRARARHILLRSAMRECLRLDQAAGSGENETMSRAAHRTRGALAAAGLVRLAELAEEAERRAGEGRGALAAAKLRQVSGGLRRLAGRLTSA